MLVLLWIEPQTSAATTQASSWMEQRAAAGVLRPACELADPPLRDSQRVALCRRSRAACQGRGGRRCPSGRADRNVHSLFLSFPRPARVSFEEPGPAPARERPRLHRPNRVELPCSEHRRAHRSLRPPTAEAKRVEEAHIMRGRHPLGDRVMLAELCVLFSVLVRIGVGNNRFVQRNRSEIYFAQSATGLGGELKKVVRGWWPCSKRRSRCTDASVWLSTRAYRLVASSPSKKCMPAPSTTTSAWCAPEVGPGAGRVECTALGLPPIVRLRVEQVVVAEELEACRAFARERYDVARVAPRGPSEHHRQALGKACGWVRVRVGLRV